mmetsp:Transcript_16898/g.48180  ORF Transcript_16898/g.48180 Transcript_16898/m.48180 type:complete len:132 (+) Transcript_16898:191-586(+)
MMHAHAHKKVREAGVRQSEGASVRVERAGNKRERYIYDGWWMASSNKLPLLCACVCVTLAPCTHQPPHTTPNRSLARRQKPDRQEASRQQRVERLKPPHLLPPKKVTTRSATQTDLMFAKQARTSPLCMAA